MLSLFFIALALLSVVVGITRLPKKADGLNNVNGKMISQPGVIKKPIAEKEERKKDSLFDIWEF